MAEVFMGDGPIWFVLGILVGAVVTNIALRRKD